MTEQQEVLFRVRTLLMKTWKTAQELSRQPDKINNLSIHNLRLKIKNIEAILYNMEAKSSPSILAEYLAKMGGTAS